MPRKHYVAQQEKARQDYDRQGVTCYGYGPRPETEIGWLQVWGESVPEDLIGTATPAEEARVARWKRRHNRKSAWDAQVDRDASLIEGLDLEDACDHRGGAASLISTTARLPRV